MSAAPEVKPKPPDSSSSEVDAAAALDSSALAVAAAEAAVAAAAAAVELPLATPDEAPPKQQEEPKEHVEAPVTTAAATAVAASGAGPDNNAQDEAGGGGGGGDDDDDEDEEVKPSIEVEPSGRATTTKRLSDVGERDVVLNSREDNHKMFLFLEDMVQMYVVLWTLRGTVPSDVDLDRCSRHIVQLLKAGKRYELGGVRDVPRPCLKSVGRILERDDKGAVRAVTDEDAAASVRKMLVDRASAHKNSLGEELAKESPYKEFKQRLERNARRHAEATAGSPQVESGDLILESCHDDETEAQPRGETKVVYNTGPQQLVFNLAAQIVTMYTINAETQVKAALAVLNGLDEAHFVPVTPSDGLLPRSASSSHPRVLLRSSPAVPEGDAPIAWSVVSEEDIVEFAVTFVFEVHLEKDLDYMHSMLPDNHATQASEGMSKVPIKDPTTYDVLFGRGGMTNSHAGNRRFRDIIALHRPDYIRAIKMDKPTVARKIVKAIRFGSPPGRFLKKSEDGNWYDVGDRTAAEKTSQGLRERTNAEKRQRSQLRRALRLRKEDMEDDDKEGQNAGSTSKKAKTNLASVVSLAASLAPTLNYVGTNVAVPLSLNMGQATPPGTRKKAEAKVKPNSLGLNTAGLPPNAVDDKGNILVTDYDILLGRGGLTNHHKGNKRFRDIVALHRPDYVRAPKIQKPSVARVIVRAIRNGDPPGRFLRKDDKSGLWIDVGDKKAAEKTSQALREKATEERDKDPGEPSTGGTGILVPAPLPSTYLAATTANVMGNILASGTFTGSAESAGNTEKTEDAGTKEEPPVLEVKEEPKAASEPPLQAASEPPLQAASEPPLQAASEPPLQAASEPPLQAMLDEVEV